MIPNSKKTTIGDCDCCVKTGVTVYNMHHNMTMCEECRDKENVALEQNARLFNEVVGQSRKVDEKIELKQDIFNAATVSFVELQAAIEQDDRIPADKKHFTLASECAVRLEKFNQVIFAEETSLMAKKNERHAWLVQTQLIVAKLKENERGNFKQLDVNYKPQTPKSVKPKAVKTSSKKFDKTAVFEAAKKYNVPAAAVQSVVISKNMSPEDAAKHMAGLLGLL